MTRTEVVPESVVQMLNNSKAPTAPLIDFIRAYTQDDNIWWMLAPGHHLNLFDAAIDALEEALEDVEESVAGMHDAMDRLHDLRKVLKEGRL